MSWHYILSLLGKNTYRWDRWNHLFEVLSLLLHNPSWSQLFAGVVVTDYISYLIHHALKSLTMIHKIVYSVRIVVSRGGLKGLVKMAGTAESRVYIIQYLCNLRGCSSSTMYIKPRPCPKVGVNGIISRLILLTTTRRNTTAALFDTVSSPAISLVETVSPIGLLFHYSLRPLLYGYAWFLSMSTSLHC